MTAQLPPPTTAAASPAPRFDERAARSPRLPVQLSSFVGREREIAVARQRVASTRLLTFTGVGGSGKTRLALEIAAREAAAYDGDVTWVELAPVARGALVAATVLGALGASEQPGRSATEALVGVLRDRRALLVLDNCEHLVEECAALADTLLRACPGLRILATSREALGVAGETAWLVPPLSLPTSPSASGASEAVQLFVERARSVVPDFALGDAGLAAVAQICRRLDGLPLALELAAARLRALPLERIAERLDDRFRLLTTGSRTALPRHQTLRAAMDWSYDLLAERERRLLERLAVFAGGFSLDAAEAVCAGSDVERDDVLDLVAGLVEKSLVTLLDVEDAARYRLLETVREYGLERLEARGEADVYRRAHAVYYAALAAEAEPHLTTARRRAWTERLVLDVDNLRDALAWSAASEPALHLRLAGTLCWFWYSAGLWTEGRQWLDAALALPTAAAPTPARAAVLFAAGALASLQGQPKVARPWLQESVELARRFGDGRLEAYALNYVAMTHSQEGEPECEPAALAALDWSRRAGDLYSARLALLILGTYCQRVGQPARARAYMEEGVEVARAFGPERELGIALNCLGTALVEQRELSRGVAAVRESLVAFRRDPQPMFTARSLELLGGVACERGEALVGATALGAADAIRQSIGSTPFKVDGEWLARHVAAGRAAVGDETFSAAYARGRAMSFEQAIDYALGEAALAPRGQAEPGAPAPRPDGGVAPPAGSTGAATGSSLRVLALGPLEIGRDGESLPAAAWSYAKPRELLLLLVCHPEGRTREQVGLALWPDASAAQLRNNFHVTLHHVRRALGGAEWVHFERGRYRIAPDRRVELDAAEFETAATSALRRARRQSAATDELRAALALYRGDFLDGEPVGDWHLPLRDRLCRLYTDALLALGDALLRDERHDEAVEVLERLVREEPLDESACRTLMTGRARAGDRSGALEDYQRLAATLAAEYGSKPELESVALFERLQRGERV